MLLLRYRKVVFEMTMGERIKILREERHMSQEELGKLCGVNRAAVNKWETGQVENIKRSTIKRLAEVFHVTPCFIMCFDEDSKATEEQIKQFNERLNSQKELQKEVTLIEEIQAQYGSDTVQIVQLFNELNENGRQKAIENLSDLSEIKRYQHGSR